GGRQRREIPGLGGADGRLHLRPPARRRAALRQRLCAGGIAALGREAAALGAPGRRVLLFRQRRQGACAVRRDRADAPARPVGVDRPAPAPRPRRRRAGDVARAVNGYLFSVSDRPTPSSPADSVLASPPCASLIRRRTSLAESA